MSELETRCPASHGDLESGFCFIEKRNCSGENPGECISFKEYVAPAIVGRLKLQEYQKMLELPEDSSF